MFVMMLESRRKRDGGNMFAGESTRRAKYANVYIYASSSPTTSVCLHEYFIPVLYMQPIHVGIVRAEVSRLGTLRKV